MSKERRRYFRINETLGISYKVAGGSSGDDRTSGSGPAASLLGAITEQDAQLEKLLMEVAQTQPKVAELVALFNQKLERIVNQLAADSHLVDRIAQKVKEANISACGIAFNNEESIAVDTRLKLELSLYPGDVKLNLLGKVVGCDASNDQSGYYWRIEFYGMNEQAQEQLIQHIVKRQSVQLKRLRRE